MMQFYGLITITLFWVTFGLVVLWGVSYVLDWKKVWKFCDEFIFIPMVMCAIFALFWFLSYINYSEQTVGAYKITFPSYEIVYEGDKEVIIDEETKYFSVDRDGDASEITSVEYANLVEELTKEE